MWLGQWSRILAPVGQAVVARLVVPVAVGRGGSERSVAAAGSGRTITMGWTLEEGQPRHRERRLGQRLVAVAAAVGREGSKRSVVAAGSGRTVTTRWTLEGEQPRQRERGPGQRLVAVAVAVGRKGSKRSVVAAAAGVLVVQRRRWIRMELMMGAEGPAVAHERTMKSG